MSEKYKDIERRARALLEGAATKQQIEQVRVQMLGRKGEIAQLFKCLPDLPADERPRAGRAANELKELLSRLINQASSRLPEREIETE
ncbi:MAG: phenylalanine--tRNA ligase subunit alpha, partial [Planctomycetes bacterium]|nr:phenylalanine--tRNA ligase subunit alpha [Planctomycetota bacterium]